MEIFNIGPLELLFIFIIALILLGPEEMVKSGRRLAIGLRKIIRSPFWASVMDTTKEIKNLPRKFIQETGLDEDLKEISKAKNTILPGDFSLGQDAFKMKNISVKFPPEPRAEPDVKPQKDEEKSTSQEVE